MLTWIIAISIIAVLLGAGTNKTKPRAESVPVAVVETPDAQGNFTPCALVVSGRTGIHALPLKARPTSAIIRVGGRSPGSVESQLSLVCGPTTEPGLIIDRRA
jgi:hypothetical protein